ncbi:MAG TPA: PSD1 and planctomycete cytochrome C domain-containing protein [Planctomycetaceae bacterium]|nr:PSD1 and planctomycete cytochrome C domain-containing protein [Planctomycetaceae bacterium]
MTHPIGASAQKAGDRSAATAGAEQFFETSVRPVLVGRCFECHGTDKQQAGLRLDSRQAMLTGGESGAVIVPGKPDESRLVEVIQHSPGDVQMPPEGKLAEREIAALTQWIATGAFWPEAAKPSATAAAAGSGSDAQAAHWAFQQVRRSPPPDVRNAGWSHSPVDAFILTKLEEHELAPSPPAEPAIFLRRVKFALLGLPPTADEIDEFAADRDPDAPVKLIDRYLASPQYGERWARHWLDVARYADTRGYVFQEDRNYPKAWTYRDWVIRQFNDDLPYDRFLMLQLAADRLVAEADPSEQAAMGYLTLGRRFLNNRADIIDDRIDVVTRGTMGLTVSCARCHDHKYDPIPTADYYSLYGVFDSSDEPGDGEWPHRLVDAPQPREPRIFLRGNRRSRGPDVPRQFLEVLAGPDRKPFTDGSGRLELARAIASPENPLTARVMVNRVWRWHFGQGLVDTPSDFGTRSTPPTHPEVLDWLASELVEGRESRVEGQNSVSGGSWSLKRLHRAILLSAVYQQASDSGSRPSTLDSRLSSDPENRLLAHFPRQRLDFEAQRDAILAVSGRLEQAMYGEPVKLAENPSLGRRSVYAFIDRQNLPGLFRTFDFATPDTHSPGRFATTVPQQALFMLNSPFVLEQSGHVAARPEVAEASDPRQQVERLYRVIYGRSPASDELELGAAFLEHGGDELAEVAVEDDALWQYGWGEFDESAGAVSGFRRLPHWTGSAWQGGASLPDPRLGWAMLRADGGHPGDAAHAVVRRWTAPRDGEVFIVGTLKHGSEQGDGVRGRIVSSRSGAAGEWTAHNAEETTRVSGLRVARGETIDLVTDCRTNPGWDGFTWTASIILRPAEGGRRLRFNSVTDFAGPPPGALSPPARYAQVLLLSNEFVHVD